MNQVQTKSILLSNKGLPSFLYDEGAEYDTGPNIDNGLLRGKLLLRVSHGTIVTSLYDRFWRIHRHTDTCLLGTLLRCLDRTTSAPAQQKGKFFDVMDAMRIPSHMQRCR